MKRDSEKRIEPWAQVNGTPMARRTWEGSSDPEVQALPDDAQIPNSDNSSRMASPSTNSKAIEVVFGSLCTAAVDTGVWNSSHQGVLKTVTHRLDGRIFSFHVLFKK